jgi:hypothetical protein
VLRPLLDVAPDWRHPVLKERARSLWREAQSRGEGKVIGRLERVVLLASPERTA